MSDLVEWWRGLSAFWRTFVAAFPVLLVLFTVLLGGAVVAGAISALIWSAAAGSIARMRERLRERR